MGSCKHPTSGEYTVVAKTVKVKCVNNTLEERNLEIGKIYDAIENDLYYVILLQSPYPRIAYRKNRFVVVSEFSTKSNSFWITNTDDNDPEETRLRKLLSPTILSHECICGITRSDCSYHR